jgi:carbamate kinase
MARASRLYILTDVPGAAVSFGGDSESFITRASSTEMKAHLSRGQFGPGSMAPKVEACLEFLQHGGECAIIASVDEAGVALSGEAGTIIVPG